MSWQRPQSQSSGGRSPIAYTDSIFDGDSDQLPRGSQIQPPEILRLVIYPFEMQEYV